jgi:pyrroloquinoline quinone biosynthesis protein D
MIQRMTRDSRPKLASRARVDKDKLTGKPVVLFPEGVLILNPTGEAIVSLCDGERTFDTICETLAGKFSTTPSAIAADVAEYLERLRVKNLIEVFA